MRRRGTIASVLSMSLAALALAAGAAAAEGKKASSGNEMVKGEVLDLACYIAEGAKGPGHAECAKECVKGGQPMGLLAADGTVYVLLAEHDDATAYNKTKELAGKQVEITGTKAGKGALKGITVHDVKAL